jgi:hypothetical protein
MKWSLWKKLFGLKTKPPLPPGAPPGPVTSYLPVGGGWVLEGCLLIAPNGRKSWFLGSRLSAGDRVRDLDLCTN